MMTLKPAILVALSFTAFAASAAERPPQYIMISFDGSYTNEMWKATRELGTLNKARFTHFISGVDFLVGSDRGPVPGETKQIYEPPRFNGKQRSRVGFGGTRELVAQRIREVIASIKSKMEIGGHANGHFDGSAWTEKEWNYEFDLFHHYLWNVISINKIGPLLSDVKESDWKALQETQHVGFRAPYLGRGEGLWATLGKKNWVIDQKNTGARYRYDASQVSKELSSWPTKNARGFWNFPLVTIPVPNFGKPVLSMDYNFYFSISGEKDQPARAKEFEDQMYTAYVKWFSRNYFGNRAPLNIGHHFSTWNKGAYWKALQRFVKTVCNLPEVECVTYSEMVKILDRGLGSKIPQLSRGEFDQSGRPRFEIPLVVQASAGNADTRVDLVLADGTAAIPNQVKDVYTWKVGGRPVDGTRLDLIGLAKSGTSYVELTRKSDGKNLELLIDWNPADNHVELHALEEPDLNGCSAQAHEEAIDPRLLLEGQEI